MDEDKIRKDLYNFHNIFIKCLDKIDKSYYKTTYENISKFHQFIDNRGEIDGANFHRYGERIFCYELYHQLRIAIEEERLKNPSFLEALHLQGEVAKWQEQNLMEENDMRLLENEYIPDFLLHTAGKFHLHAYVIEVKSNPKLSSSQMLADLNKINEFTERFRYRRGIFLAINIAADKIEEMIKAKEEQIKGLDGRGKIAIISKERQGKEEGVFYLRDV